MHRTTTAWLLLAATGLVSNGILWADATGIFPVSVRLEPAKAWVGPARIHLEVAELRVRDDVLEGRYNIRVPLMPSQNDNGWIRFEVAEPLDEVKRSGGTLSGHAQSDWTNRRSPVTCTFKPDGRVRIEVVTSKRTLSFKSRIHSLRG